MKPNRLRDLLKGGLPTLGTRLHTSWPSVVEAIGHTGLFDYVEFLAEYAPYHLYALDDFCRAAELYHMSAMIKLDQASRYMLAQQAVGAGFQSVLFANCRSAQEAQECIRSVRPDTPQDKGKFGAVFSRFGYMNYGGGAEYTQALREVVVVIMIEKKPAVDVLEEILALDGIDMIQWGPADYSMSAGMSGGRADPEVKAVERRVIETAIKMGITPRAEIASPDDARYYLDLGVRHFSLGTDLSILFNWLKSNGEALRKTMQSY
jgi:2-keto-3-deoxy-L-rhamnonate aldolase RhmA